MLGRYSSFANLITSPCPCPLSASVKTSSGVNRSRSRPRCHRRVQLLLPHQLTHRLQHPLTHCLRHPITDYHQHQLVLHQCHLLHQFHQLVLHQWCLLHQFHQLPTRHHITAGMVQTGRIYYQGITPHLMLIHPVAIQHYPYSPNIVKSRSPSIATSRSPTAKCPFRSQAICRISTGVWHPWPFFTYYRVKSLYLPCLFLLELYDVILRILEPRLHMLLPVYSSHILIRPHEGLDLKFLVCGAANVRVQSVGFEYRFVTTLRQDFVNISRVLIRTSIN